MINYYNNIFIPYFLEKLEINKDKYFTILKEIDEMDLLYFLINFENDFNVTVNDYFLNIKEPQKLFDIMFRQKFKNEPKYTNAMNSWLEDLKEKF